MHIATGVHIRLCSSNTTFNHVSDCSVQCMNRTINPPATVTRAVTLTTITENVIAKLRNKDAPAVAVQDKDKLTKNRTEQALCNRPTYIIPTVQYK